MLTKTNKNLKAFSVGTTNPNDDDVPIVCIVILAHQTCCCSFPILPRIVSLFKKEER